MSDIAIAGRIFVPRSELGFSFARAGGHGGQNVNKVNSKAVMRWKLDASPGVPLDVKERFRAQFGSRITQDGDVVIQSDEHRDQPMNVEACIEKLSAMLASVAVPPKPRRKTRPSRSSVKRRLNEKSAHSRKKNERRRGAED